MEQKSKVVGQLTPEQIEAFKKIEMSKKASKVTLQMALAEAQEKVIAAMQAADQFWLDACEKAGITPNERLFINPQDNTLNEFIEEDDEITDKEINAAAAAVCCGSECNQASVTPSEPEVPAEPVNQESGFDALPNDSSQKERQKLAKKRQTQ